MKHTPTPFNYDGQSEVRINDELIATAFWRNKTDEYDKFDEAKANADFIVKSCNIIGHLEAKGLIDLEKVTPEAMEEVIKTLELIIFMTKAKNRKWRFGISTVASDALSKLK